jgi:hypothetical protein
MKNSRLAQWLQDIWRVDADSQKPTWFGATIIFLLKFTWSIITILWWVIVQYLLFGACALLVGIKSQPIFSVSVGLHHTCTSR